MKTVPTKKQLKQDAADAAKAVAEAAAEQAALDLAAKASCRLAIPALLAPLELFEDVILIIGKFPDVADIAATPAIVEGCVKGIEKEGKAEFKVFQKRTYPINEQADRVGDNFLQEGADFERCVRSKPTYPRCQITNIFQ